MVQLDFAILYTVGGYADYLKMSKDADVVDPKGRIYYAEFEHIQTGEIHEHAIGKIYNSLTTLLTIRAGIRLMLD
jgi:hypothetical protein